MILIDHIELVWTCDLDLVIVIDHTELVWTCELDLANLLWKWDLDCRIWLYMKHFGTLKANILKY